MTISFPDIYEQVSHIIKLIEQEFLIQSTGN